MGTVCRCVDVFYIDSGWVWSLRRVTRRTASRSVVIVAVFPVLGVGSCQHLGVREEGSYQEGDGPRPPVKGQRLQAEGLISKQMSNITFYFNFMVSLPLSAWTLHWILCIS